MSIQVISFNCLLKNKSGQLISSTYNHDVLTSTSDPNVMLKGLANGLQNLKKGDKRSISLTAQEAYGLYDPKKVILFPRKKLPRQLRVGQAVSITSKTGVERAYKVAQITGDMVSLDGNHPLAGQDLIFEIEAVDARDATPDEINDAATSTVTTPLLH